ncbi:hypothetical protein JWS13_04515 (plasmid) [Rhodococcus pseudokoreensis]|uniref:Signal transduction histidine kinase n=1 Tax=Rhodococcus pseudokoreensis TaxID=2811421 RepID=A0A974VYD5_9NOCA|nr:hypothetical protein [Rhodococcus pseudokoreensis]QSE87885.1 hypothetical protein JWS13_04515 [Rhodococcus pseudokoreensis]
MTTTGAETRDVRELLGLRSTAAKTVVAAYVLTFLLVSTTTSPGPGALLAELAAWLIVSVGAAALILVPGDPLPTWTSAALTVSGPIAVTLVLAVVPVPIDGLLQLWPLAASTAIYTYMCVRGRTLLAWAGMAATLSSCVLWAARTGQGASYGIGISAINLAPLLMATFFAWTIRPAARRIFDLREQTTIRVAAQAADTAILDERDRQLRRLDDLARPLLERISVAEHLTDDDRLACRLLEAHLRDTLRAPALVAPGVVTAVRAARARGVDVIMLDDHGMNTTPTDVRDRIHTAVADTLAATTHGTLTIRVLPPHRHALVTILRSDHDDVARVEFGHDGHRLTRPNRTDPP